jgi:outer membrane autotransporter protein
MTIKDGATVSAGTAIAIATTAGGSGSLSIGAESGSAAAAAGFVDTSLIAFGAGDGHLVFNHTDTDYLLSSAITGSGAIDVYSGFTTLTGDLGAYFGEATVKGGRLSINSNFGGTAIVQDGGTLGGNGTLQAVTLESGSTLAPGNSIGTLTVNNDLDFVDGSIYAVEVDNLGHADKVVADGSITIDTGAILSVSAENGSDRGNTYQPYTTYTILEAAALSGAFGTVEDDFAFLDASVTYDSVSATLSLQRNDIAFETLAETPNQKHVAEAIDSLGGGDLYEAILGLPEEEPAGAFDQLSGEIYADLGTGLMQESLALGDLLANRLGAAYEADAAASYASSVSGYAAFEDSFDPAYRPATSVWMTGLGSRLELGAGDGTHAADATTGGFAFGADNVSETGWRLGLAAGVGHANLGLDDLMSSADSETYHLAAYAGRQFGPIGVSLGLSESWSDISTERKVAFADFSEDLKADVSARTTQSFLEAGWRSGYDLWHFEPFDRVAFAHTRTGSVEETGGSAALMSAGLEAKSWVNTLGLRVGRDIAVNGTLGKLRGSVAWRRTLSDTASTASLSFDGSKTFLVSGADAARDAALISLGADLEIAPGALLSVDYVATMSEESQGQDISARLKVEF